MITFFIIASIIALFLLMSITDSIKKISNNIEKKNIIDKNKNPDL